VNGGKLTVDSPERRSETPIASARRYRVPASAGEIMKMGRRFRLLQDSPPRRKFPLAAAPNPVPLINEHGDFLAEVVGSEPVFLEGFNVESPGADN